MAAPVDVNALPLILFDDDVCRVFGISRTTLRKLRRHGAFPIVPLPALDKRTRYSRVDVARFLARETTPALARRRAG